MIKLRWKKVENPHAAGAVCVGNSDFSGEMVVLQYREYLDFSDTGIPEMMWTDWQDVEISDD